MGTRILPAERKASSTFGLGVRRTGSVRMNTSGVNLSI